MNRQATLWRVMALAAVVAVSPLGAQQTTRPGNSPKVPSDPVPGRIFNINNNVQVETDVVYSTIPGYRPLTLDLYHPRTRGNHPLVVFVHGGGWMIGNRRGQAGLADLAARGYAVASIDYRLAKEAPFPAATDDLRTAIRYLKANAAKFDIDPQRVALWGASAGAQVAGLAASDCGHAPSSDDKSNPSENDCVQAAALWFGVYDFATLPDTTAPAAVTAYLGCERKRCAPDRIAAASAIAHVNAKDPPMLIMHGTADKTVPMSQSQDFAAMLKKNGVEVRLELIADVGHTWAGRDAAATAQATQRALDSTFSFLDAHLKQPW